MATQTGSYDFKSTKAAKESAEKVATNFVATDSLGMMVYDGTSGTHTPSNPGTNTRNVLIDSDSVDIRQGTDVLATFGSPTRIGKSNAENVTINSDGLTVNTPNLQSAARLTSVFTGDVYAGDIVLGGIHGGQNQPYIRGYTNDTAEANEIEVCATANGGTYTATSRLYAGDEEDNYAEIKAETSNRYPSVSLSATDSSGDSFIYMDPSSMTLDATDISFQTDTVNISGSLILNNHDDPVGTVISSGEVTIDNIASGGSLKVTDCSVDVTPGVWIVNYYARFPANATGYRGIRLGIGTTSDITRSDIFCQASNSGTVTTRLAGSITQKLTADRTYTLKVMQGSGSAMSGIVGGIVATRLA